MVNEINTGEYGEKAASYPLMGGGFYRGTVLSKVDGKIQIDVRDLGCVFKEVEFLGQTTTYSLSIGDQVICGFLNHQSKELFVLGAISKKVDVFASQVDLTALALRVTALEA